MSARLRWIIAIVALLGGNVIAMVVLAVVAGTGANQVIPAYYDKAVNYDDEMARATASAALGWRAEVAMVGGALEVTVTDAAGRAIDGATVRVTGYPRAQVGDALDVALPAVGAGRYRGTVRERTGWHDLTVFAERAGARYSQHVAVEAR